MSKITNIDNNLNIMQFVYNYQREKGCYITDFNEHYHNRGESFFSFYKLSGSKVVCIYDSRKDETWKIDMEDLVSVHKACRHWGIKKTDDPDEDYLLLIIKKLINRRNYGIGAIIDSSGYIYKIELTYEIVLQDLLSD